MSALQLPAPSGTAAGCADIAAFLGTVELFRTADRDVLAALARDSRLQTYGKGDTIFRTGDLARSIYVVQRGEVAEFAPGPNGVELPVKVRRRGDFFGEIGVITSGTHVVREVARSDTTLVVISGHQFMTQINESTQIAMGVIKVLSRRLVQAGGRVVTLARLDAEAQVADYLLWLEQEEGGRGAVTISQEAIADACGLARQTVARIVASWRSAGVVRTSRGEVQLPGLGRLRTIVSSSAS